MKDLPSPRQLRYLVALSETQHFGRAAFACSVTQSTLSAGVKELEATLGATLVERSKRSVVITPLGRIIAARAREALQYMDDMVDLAQSGKGGLAGPLNLGVIPTIGPYLLPAFLGAAGAAFPKLKIFVREEQTAPLLARLREGALDLALIALPYDTAKLTTAVIGEEDVVACLSEAHPLARRKAITIDDLATLPLMMLEDGHCLRDHALAACNIAARRTNEIYQATSLATLIQMVRGDLGATLLPRMAVTSDAHDLAGVAVRPLSPRIPARQVALVWRETAVKSAEYVKLAEMLSGVFKAQLQGRKAR